MKTRQFISQETIIDQIVARWRWNLRMVHDLIMSHGIDDFRTHRYLLNKHGITLATFKWGRAQHANRFCARYSYLQCVEILWNRLPVRMFNGKRWVKFDNVSIAADYTKLMHMRLYGGSSRSTPTGYGLLAAMAGYIVGYISTNGIVYEAEHVSLEPFHYSRLGLNKTSIAKDMRMQLYVVA